MAQTTWTWASMVLIGIAACERSTPPADAPIAPQGAAPSAAPPAPASAIPEAPQPAAPSAAVLPAAADTAPAPAAAGTAQPTGQAPADKPPISRAEVDITGLGGGKVAGHLVLSALPDKAGVQVTGELHGLPPGRHGMHVHEVGDCSARDGMSAGGHFNPTAAPHGRLEAAASHVGDFGNIVANAKGVAKVSLIKPAAVLDGPASLVGHSIIVHRDADDLKSQPVGNSGARIACGVIRSH